MARARGAIVVVAGSDVTDHPERYLARGADYVAARRGRPHRLTSSSTPGWRGPGRARHTIPGLDGVPDPADADGVRRTRRPSPERHPDAFPFPAWDLVDVERYRAAWAGTHGYFTLNMVSTRGCPFHCNWCAKPIWGQRYAMRSPANVAEELAWSSATIRPDHIWFADDIFGLRPRLGADVRARGRARATRASRSRCQSRVRPDDPRRGRGASPRAGCREVWLGAESGSQKILDAMDKGITVAQIRERGTRAEGRGHPGLLLPPVRLSGRDVGRHRRDRRDGARADARRHRRQRQLSAARHAFLRDGQAELGDQRELAGPGDLAMMFAGTYTTQLYRRLHKALHDDLDMRRRQAGLSRAKHPLIPEVSLDEQIQRVEARWVEIREVEVTARHPNPTRLRIPIMAVAGD